MIPEPPEDIEIKSVSTLLEILAPSISSLVHALVSGDMFQPFLRFWLPQKEHMCRTEGCVSTLLEILGGLHPAGGGPKPALFSTFQPFLRFWLLHIASRLGDVSIVSFNPS